MSHQNISLENAAQKNIRHDIRKAKEEGTVSNIKGEDGWRDEAGLNLPSS